MPSSEFPAEPVCVSLCDCISGCGSAPRAVRISGSDWDVSFAALERLYRSAFRIEVDGCSGTGSAERIKSGRVLGGYLTGVRKNVTLILRLYAENIH